MKSERCKLGRAIIAAVVILAVLVFVFAASSASATKTIYVPTDYPTIQQAIDAASPGDTVFVWNGTYYEDGGVSITKDRLTLQGEDANTTTIHGMWTAEKVVYVNGNYVKVSDFTVAGSTFDGSGIYVDADNCIISDNHILDGSRGIYFNDSDSSTVSHNNVSERNRGIYLYYSSDCLISDNIANSCTGWESIYLVFSDNCNIVNNIVNSNKYTFGRGICLEYSKNCKLKNNIANSNMYSNIDILDSSNNCTLENNTANSSKRRYGVRVRGSSNCTLKCNIANLNDLSGLMIDYSSNCLLIDNSANSNGDHGIYLWSSSNGTLENNTANLNHNNGIHSWNSSNCIITNNIADTNDYGIYLVSMSTNNIITKNNISNNNYGMYLDYSGNNEIYHNNFINNNKQAYDHHGFNSWDKGPIIGGNYWSDHVCHGNPSDGTEPYTGIDTDALAVDNYPFEDLDGWVTPTPTGSFDTGSGTYPSIMGNHTGTIKPNHTVIAAKMYTYPCLGTGGHTEYVKIWNSTWNATAIWDGYVGDWHNISFSEPFTLKEGIKYNYTIITGSYPQIHHTDRLEIDDGEITCAAFIDANGKRHNNWIPAIRLE